MRERDHLDEPGIDDRIILSWIIFKFSPCIISINQFISQLMHSVIPIIVYVKIYIV
jgi:hypothetical protein